MKVDKNKFKVSSDLHFFHHNVLAYCSRPWTNIEDMNEGLVTNWNSVVNKDDKAFIIGDVGMGGKSKGPLLANILSRMNGDKYLVPGNHDTYILEDSDCLEQITVLPSIYEVKLYDPSGKTKGGQKIILCHYALKVWNLSHRGSWNLYGHSHHTMPPDYNMKALDVGIDGKGYDYKPLSFNQLEELMSMHKQVPVDHHDSNTY
jgi:calcineurin-like phosphoesterase family protein